MFCVKLTEEDPAQPCKVCTYSVAWGFLTLRAWLDSVETCLENSLSFTWQRRVRYILPTQHGNLIVLITTTLITSVFTRHWKRCKHHDKNNGIGQCWKLSLDAKNIGTRRDRRRLALAADDSQALNMEDN